MKTRIYTITPEQLTTLSKQKDGSLLLPDTFELYIVPSQEDLRKERIAQLEEELKAMPEPTQEELVEAASIGTLVASPFIIKYEKEKWGWYIGTYACLRYTFFDYTYNATRGLPLSYRGTTSVYDEVLGKAPPSYINFTKYVSFVVGVSIPLDKFRNKNWVKRYN
jgi:hypothetical protein